MVEIVEGTASDEKIDSYNAETIVETLSATLSIDVSRLKSMGWQSKISLENGLTRTIKEFSDSYKKSNLRL